MEDWEPWEAAVMLLAIDWYTAGGKTQAQWGGPAAYHQAGRNYGILSIVRDWIIFLHDAPCDLRSNRLMERRQLGGATSIFSSQTIRRKWYDLKFDHEIRTEAVYALMNQVLPMREELEAQFSIRICYIQNDKLPAGDPADLAGQQLPDDGTSGQYHVTFSPRRWNTEEIWGSEKAAREERQIAYDLALRQTWDRINSPDAALQQPNNNEGAQDLNEAQERE
ncbi:hypothetical protein OCU04_001095 [Sclerotinia nivalis]|uniref:Uncharacterized protein n=1 Tax=Sclerotinia nivalis TaxID=352851 RepID=A0A9X0AXF1_9HELO|nr:hypothetical protein OCU04_001095 [Sclerotinia nivalis]